jgi:hypothetical protein
MKSIEDLIYTLEVIRDAVWAKDKDKGFEAVTVFLMQFMTVFGHSPTFVSKMFPTLEELKDKIQTEQFEDANPIVLALLVRIRQVNEAMNSSAAKEAT